MGGPCPHGVLRVVDAVLVAAEARKAVLAAVVPMNFSDQSRRRNLSDTPPPADPSRSYRLGPSHSPFPCAARRGFQFRAAGDPRTRQDGPEPLEGQPIRRLVPPPAAVRRVAVCLPIVDHVLVHLTAAHRVTGE